MERSSFFNAELINDKYDRTYNAEDFARYFASFIGSGIFPNPTTNLQVRANNGMSVVVSKGKAWINGYFYENTEDLNLNLATAHGVLKRIDRIVVRLDLSARLIRCAIKKGSESSSPNPPNLQRDSDIFELALADILVENGAVKITQSNITDQRFNADLCGIVSGVVDQIDTTNLFAQFENEFTRWFTDTKATLGSDVAGNLLNKINDLTVKLLVQNLLEGGNIDGDLTVDGKVTVTNGLDLSKFKLYNVQAIQNDGKEMLADDFLGNTHINATGKAVRIGYGNNTKEIITHKPLHQYASYLVLNDLNTRAYSHDVGLTKQKVDELMNLNDRVRTLTDNGLYEPVDSDLSVNTNLVISQLIDEVLALRNDIEELKEKEAANESI